MRSLAVLVAAASVAAFVASESVAAEPDWVDYGDEGFSIHATEVTASQFRSCVDDGACSADDVDAQCNYGNPERGDHPVNCVTYDGAERFCTWVGGRICLETEWLEACAGPEERAFPYGDQFDLAACNVQSTTDTVDGRTRATMPVGTLETCDGGLPGIRDMAGNVAEWVAPCKGDYCKFRGAGYLSNDPVDRFAACQGVCSGNQRTLRSGVVGFRCCRDFSGN